MQSCVQEIVSPFAFDDYPATNPDTSQIAVGDKISNFPRTDAQVSGAFHYAHANGRRRANGNGLVGR